VAKALTAHPRGGEGPLRHRSDGGLAIFGAWGLGLAAVVGVDLRGSLSEGKPPWFAVAWMAGILVLALGSTSVQVTLATDGEIEFRGVLRRRRWDVVELRSVRPGAACRVFTFARGSALLPTTGGPEWEAVLARVLELNPAVEAVEAVEIERPSPVNGRST